MATDRDMDPEGPTETDLAAIERQWPLIEAESALVDAEIRVLTTTNGPSPLDWRRLRRAEHRVLREIVTYLAREYDVQVPRSLSECLDSTGVAA